MLLCGIDKKKQFSRKIQQRVLHELSAFTKTFIFSIVRLKFALWQVHKTLTRRSFNDRGNLHVVWMINRSRCANYCKRTKLVENCSENCFHVAVKPKHPMFPDNWLLTMMRKTVHDPWTRPESTFVYYPLSLGFA